MDGKRYVERLVEALGVGGGQRLGSFLRGIISEWCIQVAVGGTANLCHGEGGINGWLVVGAGLAGWLQMCTKDVGGTLFCCIAWRR